MRNFWSATITLFALAGLLVQTAAAQQYERDSNRSFRNQPERGMDDDEDDYRDYDANDDDDDRYEVDDFDDDDSDYSSQYGSDRTRTSRDYGDDRNNQFGDNRDERSDREKFYSGWNRDWLTTDDENKDAPHSATRTHRRNRFDDETSQFEDDEYASRSYDPRGDRPARRSAESNDYSDGMWSRALSSRNRSDSRRGDDDSSQQTWSAWWSNWFSDSDDAPGERNERFASGADEFIRQHDENDDNHLNQREMPRGMLENFHDLDANDDDYLSRSELQRHGRTMFQHLAQQQQQQSSSSRHSQSVVQGVPIEVTYVWIMDTQSGRVQLSDLQSAYDLLQRMDEDNDGHITRSELRERRQQVVARWIDHGFHRLDRNEDDAISRREAEQSMLQERFDRLDANRDGELTRNELRRSAEHASAKWGPQEEDAYLSETQDEDSRR